MSFGKQLSFQYNHILAYVGDLQIEIFHIFKTCPIVELKMSGGRAHTDAIKYFDCPQGLGMPKTLLLYWEMFT